MLLLLRLLLSLLRLLSDFFQASSFSFLPLFLPVGLQSALVTLLSASTCARRAKPTTIMLLGRRKAWMDGVGTRQWGETRKNNSLPLELQKQSQHARIFFQLSSVDNLQSCLTSDVKQSRVEQSRSSRTISAVIDSERTFVFYFSGFAAREARRRLEATPRTG